MVEQQNLRIPSNVSLWDVLAILWRRLWVIILCIGVALGVAYYISRHTQRAWLGSAQLIVLQIVPTVTTQSDRGAQSMVESTETQLSMLQSTEMARRTIIWLKNKPASLHLTPRDIPRNVLDFQKAISVLAPKDTNLINVSVEAGSRARAKLWTDAVCDAFVDWKHEVAQRNLEKTIDSLDGRLQRAQAQMQRAESRETAYKNSHHVVDVPVQQHETLNQYQIRENETLLAKQDLQLKQTTLKDVEARRDNENEKLRRALLSGGPTVRDDGEVIRLQSQLSQLLAQRSSMEKMYTKEYPGVWDDIDGKIADTRRRLNDLVVATRADVLPNIQRQGSLIDEAKMAALAVNFAQTKLAGLVQQRDLLKSQLSKIPAESMEYARLARETEIGRGLYSTLNVALSTARINKDQASGNILVSSPAIVPADPVRPNLLRDLLFGGLAGLFLSMIAVFALEQSDRRVRTVERVRTLGGGPVIGALPRLSHAQLRAFGGPVMQTRTREAYNLIRANLSLALPSVAGATARGGQVLLITSTVPGEGKSTIAAHMSRSLARSGKSVILVDGDMRRPTQNLLFNTDEPQGLADVLVGEIPLGDALVSSNIDHLSILHSGRSDANPSDLFAWPQMKQVLDVLRQEADFVIVDTPAASAVADALILAPLADCILHVVGVGQVDEDEVQETAAALRMANPRTFAYIVNRAPKDKASEYKKYYTSTPGAWGNGTVQTTRQEWLRILPPAQEDVAAE